MMKILKILLALGGSAYLALLGVIYHEQSRLEFFPSHQNTEALGANAGLVRWVVGGTHGGADTYIGMKREVANPQRVWLFAHGNGGQAAGRKYAMRYFGERDSVYVVEYPGFGDRPGEPDQSAINAAVESAYRILEKQYGNQKICVLGESLGSGPASYLGSIERPPRRIVLVVPFDRITSVAQERFPFIPAGLLMRDHWDNAQALSQYPGRLDIWGGCFDETIPVTHARNLARLVKRAVYHEFSGGHGWAGANAVSLAE